MADHCEKSTPAETTIFYANFGLFAVTRINIIMAFDEGRRFFEFIANGS
jgi:hypothetical protein